MKLFARVALAAVSAVFAIGLTFAAVELPRQVNVLLQENFEFPHGDSGPQGERAEPFVEAYNLRWIGYASLFIIVGLTAVGLASERSRWIAGGAVALFLPVFGHFCKAMFFLSGLGVLRVLWLPLFDLDFSFLRLGEVAFVPFAALTWLADLIEPSLHWYLPSIIMVVGVFLFALGTMTWLQARVQKRGTADFWIYRFSRHPQYLGWIVWSYGLLLFTEIFAEVNFKISYVVRNSLPWLISTMLVFGVALTEEIQMRRQRGAEYTFYQSRVPLLFPVPRFIARLVSWPMRLVLRKELPESGREVAVVVLLYAVILVLISVPCMMNDWPPLYRWHGEPPPLSLFGW